MNSTEISDKLLENKYEIFCSGIGYYDENAGCRIGSYRYKLEIKLEDVRNNKTLACVMMNPSTTFPDDEWENISWKDKLGFPVSQKCKTKGFDPTVRNIIRMAYSKGYSKVCIFNLFPYIQPKSDEALKHYSLKKEKNKKQIEKWLKENNDCHKVLIAWGSKMPTNKNDRENYIRLQKEYIVLFKENNILPVFYEWNKEKNCPFHPSMQVNSCLTKDKKGNIVKRTKGKKSEKGIIQLFIDNNEDFKKFPKNYFC